MRVRVAELPTFAVLALLAGTILATQAAEHRSGKMDKARMRSARISRSRAGGVAELPALLRVLHTAYELRGVQTATELAKKLGIRVVGDRALVTLRLNTLPPSVIVGRLEGLGIEPLTEVRSGERTQTLVPFASLQRLIGIQEIRGVEVTRAYTTSAVSEGVGRSGAHHWQEFTPPAGLPLGRPVRVAVIDVGFDGYQGLLGLDLPTTVNAVAFCEGLPDDVDGCGAPDGHGTAVAEIIHDMAPDAKLLLATFGMTNETFDEAVDYARSWGADVINTSVGTLADNRDGSGPQCGNAAAVRAEGNLWIAAAGNEGNACFHEHYSWNPMNLSGAQVQRFPVGAVSYLNEFSLPAGAFHVVVLQWNAWGNSPPRDDFDLYYLCNFGTGYQTVNSSVDLQCGQPGTTPVEAVSFLNTSSFAIQCAYMVREYNPNNTCPHGPDVQFDAWSDLAGCLDLEHATSSYTISHPADCSTAIAAGAVCVQSSQLESFSSNGPTLDGRTKPDLCAPDSVSTEIYGPSSLFCGSAGFTGTSAASPHVAGALALLYDKVGGSFTLDQCLAILAGRAEDITGDSTPDNACGYGALCLSDQGCSGN